MLQLFPCMGSTTVGTCYGKDFCLVCFYDSWGRPRLCLKECQDQYPTCTRDWRECDRFKKLYNQACFDYVRQILEHLDKPAWFRVTRKGDAFITIKGAKGSKGFRYPLLRAISDREEVLKRMRNGRLSEQESWALRELYLGRGSLRKAAKLNGRSKSHIERLRDRAIEKIAHMF